MVPLFLYFLWFPPSECCPFDPPIFGQGNPSGVVSINSTSFPRLCSTMARHAGGRPKHATWETSATKPGLLMADLDELVWPSWEGDLKIDHWPVSMIDENSVGISFATLFSIEKIKDLRTNGPMILIIQGFDDAKFLRLGYETERLLCSNITVKDEVSQTTELRAVTIINISLSEEDFVTLQAAEHDIKVATINRFPVFVEMRQSDALPDHWRDLNSLDSFQAYVKLMLQKCGVVDQTVVYKPFSRQGYLCQRLQVPSSHRDQLYHLSGNSSVQIRAVRSAQDPPEEGLELIRITKDITLAALAEEASAFQGSLGCFKTQGKTYLRCKDDSIAACRKHFYDGDLRYNAQNIHIKQKYFFFLEGFPLGVSVHEVSSTIQSLGWAGIPLRVTHLRQLSKVLVASDRYPPKMKFTTSIGVLQVSIADKPQQIQKAAVAVAPTPTRPQIAHAESQSKWPRVEHSSNGTASSSSSMTASSTTRPSTKAPSVSLASRVTQLESQLGIVSSDVQGLKSNQDALSQQVVSLGQKQDQGFLDLLQAINSLKAGFEASSSKASPVRKAPKT